MKKLMALLMASALLLAGCSATNETTNEETSKPTQDTTVAFDEEKTADIIVVGAGAAGLSSAIAAADNGAESVIIIEKTAKTGGNLLLTSGSMSAAETSIQKEEGIEDSKELFVEDIMKNGANLGNEELVKAFVEEDTAAFEWLLEHGLNEMFPEGRAKAVFAPEHQLYSVQRTYKPKATAEGYSSAAHQVLDTYLKTLDQVSVDFDTEATQLLANEQGQVLSVLATNADGKTIKYTANKGVIMCTGGYSGNFNLLEKYAANGGDYLSSTTSMGEGLYMMQEVGAYIDEETMSYIPTFPMGVQTGERSGTIGSTYTWKAGGISVNQDGKRFVNEQEARVDVREVALEEQPGAVQYDIFTDKIVEDLRAANGSMMFDLYFAEGGRAEKLVQSASSLEELAEKINVPAENLVATVEEYNAAVDAGQTDELGRNYDPATVGSAYNLAINKIEGETYYAVPLKALCVMTLGGVTIDTTGHVLDEQGTQIPGLYAAGEVVGGIWGRFVSGGTGVMGPITFGRIAAKAAMSDELATDYTVAAASNIFDKTLFENQSEAVERFDMSTALNDGTYNATVDGQDGEMEVEVEIAGGKLAKVTIVSNHETEAIAANALTSLPETIVKENSVNVDTVTGATLTSNRILDAVTDCLNQASK
ncbi:MAG: FAD-dependent oxidoreductase [Erysipelotrichaceae bacterium]|nr:FAD-dependent oxidoreductase [Erysipelotrichaceae bacterium]MDY5251919.1 FAD-dependent oxidoreductase [Erysipelotrichaceae bacterium]